MSKELDNLWYYYKLLEHDLTVGPEWDSFVKACDNICPEDIRELMKTICELRRTLAFGDIQYDRMLAKYERTEDAFDEVVKRFRGLSSELKNTYTPLPVLNPEQADEYIRDLIASEIDHELSIVSNCTNLNKFDVIAYNNAIGWKPIETAPRNGDPVLLYSTRYGVVEAWFAPGKWEQYYEGEEFVGAAWICADDEFEIEVDESPDGYHDGHVTHWMPKPADPEPTEGEL